MFKKKKFKSPRIFITRSALHEMLTESLLHPGDETGWGHGGIIFPNTGTVIITHTLLRVDREIKRELARVAVGDKEMGESVKWLIHHDVVSRKMKGNKNSGKYTLAGKGHSHHGLPVPEHSSTDVKSVVKLVTEEGLEIVVSALVLINAPRDFSVSAAKLGTLALKEQAAIDIKFYYYSKSMADAGIKRAMLVTPEVLDADDVPMTPPLGWRFTREQDYFEQMRHLKHYGAEVSVWYKDLENGPPMEIIFTVTKPNWKANLNIVTPWDYPKNPPRFVLKPKEGMEATERGDYVGADGLLVGPVWNPGEDFLEAILRYEARGEL